MTCRFESGIDNVRLQQGQPLMDPRQTVQQGRGQMAIPPPREGQFHQQQQHYRQKFPVCLDGKLVISPGQLPFLLPDTACYWDGRSSGIQEDRSPKSAGTTCEPGLALRGKSFGPQKSQR
ncbi:hypothetical protein B0T09DRAFT_343266 [Sordaria sp. MPI-SDFR-AT-0083]|nr:hypothetical protein B0T09DRAFT_343266 [Sordaria sp. MPI-SDFR-AT-0083]